MAVRIEYVEASGAGANGRALRQGEAGFFRVRPGGAIDLETRVALTPNSAHALLGHGVVEQLNGLPLEGRLGAAREVVFPPSILDEARAILYEADRKTYGGSWEFVVAAPPGPERVEYRIRIDNREYQRTLTRLQDWLTMAGREGIGAWMRL